MLGEIPDEHDRQRPHEQRLALEERVHERREERGDDDHDHETDREQPARDGRALDDGKSPDPARPSSRDGPRDLLLQRLEEAGGGGERKDPQHRQRAVAIAPQRPSRDGEEQVRGHAGDDQPEADRRAPLGERVALAQPLAEPVSA